MSEKKLGVFEGTKWLQQHNLEVMQGELKKSSPRAKALLFTNFVEYIIKDFIQLVLDSRKARKIQRDLIVEILEEMKAIEPNLAHDIKLIFDIRDQLAHQINWILVEANLNEIFSKMKIVQQQSSTVENWNDREYSRRVTDVSDWALTQLVQAFDAYAESHGLVESEPPDS